MNALILRAARRTGGELAWSAILAERVSVDPVGDHGHGAASGARAVACGVATITSHAHGGAAVAAGR